LPEGITLSDEQNSTHSRDDDDLAQKLAANIEKSFSITEVKSHTRAEDGKEKPGVILPPGGRSCGPSPSPRSSPTRRCPATIR
jgi:hypothetical protein